ncbi:uncharacterized protein LOC131536919 [Onychostoma macrolepis]|uniref:uncharacterized protein LOC131536919 n=1 Tax=Onychostoma macrolepis TaxID=369639 RepID=UPI00272CC6E1|nr:uncharacterized protein LOC131536919 [Onychostoma macrolepis]
MCLESSSEVDETHVFISSGQNVRLSCNNALPDCKSTTWIYNRFSHSATVELIGLGIKKDTERHERLSLGSDCSLNINNITEEDYGLYTCRQYVNKQQQGTDARVFLHVLHVSSSSSSSQTEISAGRSVTLFCQLYSYAGVFCDGSGRSEGIELFWVNQAGVKLKISDSRYQISASDRCNITLTTTLLNEDHNREWRCNVTHRDRVQSSVTYTVKSSGEETISSDPDSTTAVITVTSVVAAFLAAVLCLICRKRADNKRGTAETAVKDENEDDGTYETIDVSIPAADHNDTVTYTAIRGTE